ncbi:UNVERIFIED_CONTAM: hypothetical protein FKN15_066836 [Acipenser sinensis]
MVAAPIFGYLGDRFNRKVILGCGIFFWSAVTLSSSFITKEYYWLFVLSRGLVGIGESSYSSISPTIIGDLFTNNTRTMMLSVFYFAIPLGRFEANLMSSMCSTAVHSPRAVAQAPFELHTACPGMSPSQSGPPDQLSAGRSYVFSSLASAAVSFATGAFGMWIPLYLFRAQVVQKSVVACDQEPCSIKDSMLGSAIFICLIFVAAKKSIVGAYICIFIGETLLFLNWAITADILMYVVIPTRRATAVALQSFTSHALGDAGSPYLIGLISDAIQQSYTESILWQFLSLGYALMLCPFVIVLGGMFFLATALFFLDDRDKAEKHDCSEGWIPAKLSKLPSSLSEPSTRCMEPGVLHSERHSGTLQQASLQTPQWAKEQD